VTDLLSTNLARLEVASKLLAAYSDTQTAVVRAIPMGLRHEISANRSHGSLNLRL
jgi:hypothetical protein